MIDWISTKQTLPDRDGEYLSIAFENEVAIRYYDKYTGNWWYEGFEIKSRYVSYWSEINLPSR